MESMLCVQGWNVSWLRIATGPERWSGNPPAPQKGHQTLACVFVISVEFGGFLFAFVDSIDLTASCRDGSEISQKSVFAFFHRSKQSGHQTVALFHNL